MSWEALKKVDGNGADKAEAVGGNSVLKTVTAKIHIPPGPALSTFAY